MITLEEYMVFPYKNNNQRYMDAFEGLIKALKFSIREIDETIAKKAAQIKPFAKRSN